MSLPTEVGLWPIMDEANPLQLILPTDKRNPCFSLYHNDAQTEIHVYYGLELLEVVPNEPTHVAYKLLVARLYNARVKVATLEDVFQVDRKTMRIWGQALRSRDPNQLHQVLLGRESHRKRTAALDGYVRMRYPQLRSQGTRNYRKTLQAEIEQIFGITLSGEALRQLIQEQAMPLPLEPVRSEVLPADPLSVLAVPVVPLPPAGEMSCSESGRDPEIGEASSKSTPPKWSPEPDQSCWCRHAGLLWFAGGLGGLSSAVMPAEPLLAQWLGSVLLGALNLEQTKYLHWEDMSMLLGSVVRFPTPQREQLQRLATPATIDGVLRWNLKNLGEEGLGSDLYLDPHTKHYTGMQKVLKGWCAAIRWADKAMHSDFVHTAKGSPIYFECTDNFEDLRARFAPLTQRMRLSLGWDAHRVLTVVVDRGIFSAEVFDQVIKDPSLHLITWEKGYEVQPWDKSQVSGSYALERVRNKAGDVRLYHFEYRDQKWSKNAAMRQIVVEATNPKGVKVQVSVLSDDLTRPAQEILRLMFNRWVQENDFKYLDKHFGINQITSYRSIEYEELKGQLTDRQVPSQAYRQNKKQEQALIGQQGRVLRIQEQGKRQQAQRQERIQELQLQYPWQSSELRKLTTASSRYEVYRKARETQINTLHEEIQKKRTERESIQREVSRVDQLIEAGMVRMDTGCKRVMDAIKITARNLFYQALAPFKMAYNNYRDDHDYFRQLTLAAGVLRWTGQEIQVHVLPHVSYSPKIQKIIKGLMESLNQKGYVLPDGSGRGLVFRLARKDQIEVRIRLDS